MADWKHELALSGLLMTNADVELGNVRGVARRDLDHDLTVFVGGVGALAPSHPDHRYRPTLIGTLT